MSKRDLIQTILKKIGLYPIVKSLFRKQYKNYVKREAQKSLDNFHRHGMEALSQFNACLTEHNIKYCLAFGSLLGAVREHDFIPHDDDIDVTMWIDDYKPEMLDYLKQYGFKHKASFSVNNDKFAKEDTFEYKGVLLDIFYVYRDNNKEAYCCYFEVQPGCLTRAMSIKKYGGLRSRKIYLSINEEVKRIDFKGIEISIPSNYDEVLKKVFGDDYMTPIPGWTHENFSEPKPEWLCICKEF